MQKRVVHLILAIIFLITTIVQSFGSALAVAVNKETVTANTTSKIVNTRRALEAVADSSQLESGSSSASESTASQSSSSKSSSSESKSSSSTSSSSSSATSRSASVLQKDNSKAEIDAIARAGVLFQRGNISLGPQVQLLYGNGTDYNTSGNLEITSDNQAQAGRNNFNLTSPNPYGTITRWNSIHDDSPRSKRDPNFPNDSSKENPDAFTKRSLSTSSTLYIGVEKDGVVGLVPYADSENSVVVKAASLDTSSQILTQVIDYTQALSGTKRTLQATVQFIPTAWKTVYVKESIKNTSGVDLKGVFFGRTIDTDLRDFDTGVQGASAQGDMVPLVAHGNRGLSEEQNIPATPAGTTSGGYTDANGNFVPSRDIPVGYPGGKATLFYDFNLFAGTGPDGWQASDYEVHYKSRDNFIKKDGTGNFKSVTDPGTRVSKAGGDTQIDMLWFPKDLAAGASRDIGYEVGLTGGANPVPPKITLNQSPRVMYSDGQDLNLDGIISNENPTTSDEPYHVMDETIWYQIEHKAADGTVTKDAPQELTTVKDVAIGSPKGYAKTLKASENNLKVGDRVVVWAIDDGQMYSVNHEYTDLVAPSAQISKKVRNVTNQETDFKTDTDYKPGNTVEYQGKVKNIKTNDVLPKGTVITDQLDSHLLMDPDATDNVTLTYFSANDTQVGSPQKTKFSKTHTVTTNNEIPVGGYVLITFQAKVSADATEDIGNTMQAKVIVNGKDAQGNNLTYEDNTDPSNKAIIHPAKKREVQDLKQEIKNVTKGENWSTTGETNGYSGETIGYQFSFQAKDSNEGDITDARIKYIVMTPDELTEPTAVKVTVGTGATATTVDGTAIPYTTADHKGQYYIDIATPIKKSQLVKVYFERTIKDGASAGMPHIQQGELSATLSSAPTGGNDFPLTLLNVEKQNNTATIQQFIKNRDTANETWKGPGIGDDKAETSGVPGNIIDYKFKITPGAKNTADLLATALKDIAMKESGGMTLVNPEGSVDNTKQVKVTVDGLQPFYISGNPISNSAELKDIFAPLDKGMTIEYSAKINATAAVQDVTNDANFYASNLNGDADATKFTDATHKTSANKSILHITMPLQTTTITQSIANKTNREVLGEKPTSGKAGDIIEYQFSVPAPQTASQNLINAALQDIKMVMRKQTDMELIPYDATETTDGTAGQEIRISMSNMKGNFFYGDVTDFTTNHNVTIPANPRPDNPTLIKVNYKMKIGASAVDGETITNDGNLYADNLQGNMPAGSTVANKEHKIPANKTVLNIKHKQAVTLEQKLKNETTPDAEYKAETTGAKDDIIDYQFKITAPTDNTADITGMQIDNISSIETGKLTFINDADNQDYPITVALQDATGKTVNVEAKFDSQHKVITFVNKDDPNKPVVLPAGKTMTVTYKMRVVADVDDNSTDADKLVTNDAEFKADVLTHTVGSGKLNEVVVGGQLPFPEDTKLHLEKGVGKITIRYVDRASDMAHPIAIANEVTYTGKVGKPLYGDPDSATTPTTPDPAKATPLAIPGWTVIDYTNVNSVDLMNVQKFDKAKKINPVFDKDEQVFTYRYEEQRIAMNAPKEWNFGRYGVSDSEYTYMLKTAKADRYQPYALKVMDYYGVNSWQLNATEQHQFRGTKDPSDELTGAKLELKHGKVTGNRYTKLEASNPKINGNNDGSTNEIGKDDTLTSETEFNLIPGAENKVSGIMRYQKSGNLEIQDGDPKDTEYDNPGVGEWVYTFGDKDTKDSSIGLHVPKGVKRHAGETYKTVINWELELLP